MNSEIRDYQASDLSDLEEGLGDACSWLPLGKVLGEKLGPGSGGAEIDATVVVVDEKAVGIAVTCGDRLRLLAVAPSMRGRGLGTVLLAAAEAGVAARDHGRISVLDDAGNYLAPGIDARDTETIGWLERREYERETEYESLVIDVRDNPNVTDERRDQLIADAAQLGYEVRRLKTDEADELYAHVEAEYSTAWATEVRRADTDVFIARKEGALVAFAAHDGTNRGLGWFGPAGTVPEHRGKGLGAALLLSCLCDVADQGHSECTISWIGPRTFYDRVAGIADTRRYLVFRKPIDNE